MDEAADARAEGLAYSFGIPLSEETGIGSLTLGGYLRDVTDSFGAREVAVSYHDGEARRWTYAELWDHSFAVARALIAKSHPAPGLPTASSSPAASVRRWAARYPPAERWSCSAGSMRRKRSR
jgi:hypothetical protein